MDRIAKILKSNGTGGDLLLGALEADADELEPLCPLYIEFDGLPVPFFIESCEPKGTGKAIVHLTGIDSLEDAGEVVGREILADVEFESEAEESFEGWTVTDRGSKLGTVTGMEPIPGNPCLYVDRGTGDELMIPLHEDFIIGADDEKKILELELPEGLF